MTTTHYTTFNGFEIEFEATWEHHPSNDYPDRPSGFLSLERVDITDADGLNPEYFKRLEGLILKKDFNPNDLIVKL